jgi:hypothetical protein
MQGSPRTGSEGPDKGFIPPGPETLRTPTGRRSPFATLSAKRKAV